MFHPMILNVLPSADSQKQHMIEKHEEVVVFYTVAKQVDNIEEKVDKFENFKNDNIKALGEVLDTQNSMKQELFLVRNLQADITKSLDNKGNGGKVEKDDSSKTVTYASIANKNLEKRTGHDVEKQKIESSRFKHESRNREESPRKKNYSNYDQPRRQQNQYPREHNRQVSTQTHHRPQYNSHYPRRPRQSFNQYSRRISRPFIKHNHYEPRQFGRRFEDYEYEGNYNPRSHNYPDYYRSDYDRKYYIPTSNRYSILGNY